MKRRVNLPNIVLITCDELRKDSLSCYGNQAIHTSCIDSLAETGTQFGNCYTVSPWCLPARCSILTGLYPHKSGAYSNFRKCPLDKDVPNIFTELKTRGYQTAMFGKCHFAPVEYHITKEDETLPYDDIRNYYLSLGIDHLDLEDGKQVSVWFRDDYAIDMEQRGILKAYRKCIWDRNNGRVFNFPGAKKYHPDAWTGSKAKEYMGRFKNEQPLFAWISFGGPHFPFDAPEEYEEKVDRDQLPPRNIRTDEFDSQGRIHHSSYHGSGGIEGCGAAKAGACKNYTEEYWERLRINYHANVSLIDDQVGEILKVAKDKFGGNTLILFTADHGEMLGNHGIWGKNNCAYDDVWQIPLLVKFPYQNEKVYSDAIVNSLDIMPTLMDMAGSTKILCDGRDLPSQMRTGGYDYTFSEGEGFVSVTDGRFKYIHVQKGNENFRELLDKKADPKEYDNYIDKPEYSDVLARLREKVIEHFMGKVLP